MRAVRQGDEPWDEVAAGKSLGEGISIFAQPNGWLGRVAWFGWEG